MSDFYTEQLIKKQTSGRDVFIKAIMAALAALSLLSIFFTPLGILFFVIMIGVNVVVFRRLNVEYEYLFVNGDLDIDKIMNRSKRKRMYSVTVAEMELLAPVDSVELRQYQRTKTLDYSSGNGEGRKYALVAGTKGELTKVIFEPNDTIVEGFYMLAPRKVIRR